MKNRALRKFAFAIFSAALIAGGAYAAAPVSKPEAEKFFARYGELVGAFDTAVTDLYSPTAKIVGTRQDNVAEKQQVTGAQWKQLLAFNAEKARRRNDKSTFDQVRYEAAGDKMRVRANRYSALKCYTDKSYTMLIGRQADGRLQIEEENFETHLPGSCK